MASAISFDWFQDFGKTLTIIQCSSQLVHSDKCSLRAGSLVWVGDKEPRTGEKNEARKSEPARELLIFEFRPSRGVKSAFHMCQITIQ